MLDLKLAGTVLLTVDVGARFPLPDGRIVGPAYDGWSLDGYSLTVTPPPEAPFATAELVNIERDRRMRGTFEFNGKVYGCDPSALQRITGAAALAGFYLAAGGSPTNVNWHGRPEPFAWIAHDNSIEVMDAQTVFAFGEAAAANETAHIFAARALKDTVPIPTDFTDDSYWP